MNPVACYQAMLPPAIPNTLPRANLPLSEDWGGSAAVHRGVISAVHRNPSSQHFRCLSQTGSGIHRHALSRCSQTTSEHSLKRPFWNEDGSDMRFGYARVSTRSRGPIVRSTRSRAPDASASTSRRRPAQTISEITGATGISKSTLYRSPAREAYMPPSAETVAVQCADTDRRENDQ